MNIDDIYREAMSMHRHYDTLSLTAVTTTFVTLAGTPAVYWSNSRLHGAALIWLVGGLLVWLAFSIYQRLDGHAGFALKLAEFAESGPNVPLVVDGKTVVGVAYAFSHRSDFPSLCLGPGGAIYQRIKLAVHIGYGFFAVGFLLAAL